jgi:hypothetical protein
MGLLWILFLPFIVASPSGNIKGLHSEVIEHEIMPYLTFREAYRMMRQLHLNPLTACEMNPIEFHNADLE